MSDVLFNHRITVKKTDGVWTCSFDGVKSSNKELSIIIEALEMIRDENGYVTDYSLADLSEIV